jgi:hypothetical protein
MEGLVARYTIFMGVLGALCASLSDTSALTIGEAYASVSLSLPTTRLVIVCHDFGCAQRTPVGLSDGDLATLSSLLAPGRASAEAERRAVAAAEAWFDRRVGPAAGTTRRVARASGLGAQGAVGQMDCIDTSRNSTSLLLILDQLHLLRHHKVEAPEARGFLLDGRGPHATAVLTDIHTGKQWAVDSWTHKYGEKPDVIPLDVWKQQS